jgi:hypothetical protein
VFIVHLLLIAAAAGVVSDVQRNLELRCVLAVVRHGDRTPKQKMKVTVTQVCAMAYYATAYCCYGWSMQLLRDRTEHEYQRPAWYVSAGCC